MDNAALATEREVKTVANGSLDMPEMMADLGYITSYPGGNTTKRFKRILGENVYNEINSGIRNKTAKSRWTKVRINTRRWTKVRINTRRWTKVRINTRRS